MYKYRVNQRLVDGRKPVDVRSEAAAAALRVDQTESAAYIRRSSTVSN